MLREVVNALRWSSLLGAKFFWAVPWYTSTIVLATLVAQISMVVAFFTPLKVIIMLGSDGTPRYFPPALAALDRDVLIAGLSAVAVAAYALHLLAEKVIQLAAEQGAQRLLRRSRKMVLFENQDEIATQSYKRYADVLAGGVFVGLALLALIWLYPGLAGLIAAYVVLVLAAVLAGIRLSARVQDWIESNPTDWLPVVGASGFMLAFAYLVVDFLYGDPPGLIAAIIGLLLSRQAFMRLSVTVSGLMRLWQQRPRLDALFFHRKVFLPRRTQEKNSIWALLAPERRGDWVPGVLGELGVPVTADEKIAISWWHSNARGVPMLRCERPGGSVYLLKLFDRNRAGQAQHEATLLSHTVLGLPSPAWVGATQLSGFHCHVFQVTGLQAMTGGKARQRPRLLREGLLRIVPPPAIVSRYARSRPFLWQRLDDHLLANLRVAAEGQGADLLEALRARLGGWRGCGPR